MRYLEYLAAPIEFTQCLDHGMQLLALAGITDTGSPTDGSYINPDRLMIDDEGIITAEGSDRPAERWCPPLSESRGAQEDGAALYTIGLLLHRALSGTDIISDKGWDIDTIWQISRDEAALLSVDEFADIVPVGASAEERDELIKNICALTSFNVEDRVRGFGGFTDMAFALPCSYTVDYLTADGQTAATEQYKPAARAVAAPITVGAALPTGAQVPRTMLVYRPGVHCATVRLRQVTASAAAPHRETIRERETVRESETVRAITAGIDLGTETTLIAEATGSGAQLLSFDGDAQYIPSVLMFKGQDQCVIGDVARNKGKLHPQACVSRFKRRIGDAAPITGDITALDGTRFQCTGQEAAGRFLSALRDEVSEQGIHLSRLVLTIPADFSTVQRRQSRQAILQAGFLADELRLLEEPTAAAIYYGCNKRSGVTAVVDLGGGTFDCCVLEYSSGKAMVQTKGSDMNLGGCDFTDELAALIRRRAQESGIQLAGDGTDAALTAQMDYQITTFAERMKIDLSTYTEAYARIPYRGDGTLNTFELTVRRDEFEELLAPYIARMNAVISDVLSVGGYSAEDIDSVVIMGGSTYIPCIERSIRSAFAGCSVFYDSERTAAVALGAAMYANDLWDTAADNASAVGKPATIISSVQDDLGVVDSKREFCSIIPAGTIYSVNGCSGEHKFNFTNDSISTLDIFLYRRRRGCLAERLPLFASDAKLASIGRLHFGKLPGRAMRSCTLLVRFNLDTDGTISAVGEVYDREGNVIHSETAEIFG